VVSTHPRTRMRLEERAEDSNTLENMAFHEPFGFFDYVHLQMKARCTLSDSGTISEESAMLGFPAVTLRDSIERPEALDAGSIIMTGLDARSVVEAVTLAIKGPAPGLQLPLDYCVEDTSHRVVSFIVSTAGRHFAWSGIRPPSFATKA
jgi:UDP-N-acetyl-L-fucosamine synthase